MIQLIFYQVYKFSKNNGLFFQLCSKYETYWKHFFQNIIDLNSTLAKTKIKNYLVFSSILELFSLYILIDFRGDFFGGLLLFYGTVFLLGMFLFFSKDQYTLELKKTGRVAIILGVIAIILIASFRSNYVLTLQNFHYDLDFKIWIHLLSIALALVLFGVLLVVILYFVMFRFLSDFLFKLTKIYISHCLKQANPLTTFVSNNSAFYLIIGILLYFLK